MRNAGTAMRFLTAYFAGREGEVFIQGDERMHQRPIKELVEALTHLGADIEYRGEIGFPPLRIRGKKLKGGRITIPANVSSQFISAMLMLAPTLSAGLIIEMKGNIVSEPYIQLTLSMLSYFGITYEKDDRLIAIPPQRYWVHDLFVESDWSAASYFWALASLFPGSELHFSHLLEDSWQGDSRLKELMQPFGIGYHFNKYGCSIYSSSIKHRSFQHDFKGQPDLIPTFVTLACTVGIPFNINGTEVLKWKESDRSAVLVTELQKLGYRIHPTEDGVEWNLEKDTTTDFSDEISLGSYNDHRMAMSWTLAAARNSKVWIEDPACTEKSFPGFWHEIQHLGFKTEVLDKQEA